MVFAEIRSLAIAWKKQLEDVAALRGAFLVQIVGMMLNDSAFVILWVLFFRSFGTVNGWTQWDVVGLMGFGMLIYGIAFTFCAGGLSLPRLIARGQFDGQMLTPRNLYLATNLRNPSPSAFGDTLLGLGLLIIYLVTIHASLGQIALLASFVIAATVVMANVCLSMACIVFYYPEAEIVYNTFFKSFLGPSLYPSALFPHGIKIFFTFILPSLIIGGIPIEAVAQNSLPLTLIIWGMGLLWLLLGIVIFTASVKRYESGNVVGLL